MDKLIDFNYENVVIYDIDNDGLKDVIPGIWFTNDSQISYPYFKNKGAFEFELVGELPLIFEKADIYLSDFNGDGNAEILNISKNLDAKLLTLHGGNEVSSIPFEEEFLSMDILIGDLNNDGHPDILNYDDDNINAYIFENGEITKNQNYFGNEIDDYIDDLLFYDHNQDGVEELLMIGSQVYFLRFNGTKVILERTIDNDLRCRNAQTIEQNGSSTVYRKNNRSTTTYQGSEIDAEHP